MCGEAKGHAPGPVPWGRGGGRKPCEGAREGRAGVWGGQSYVPIDPVR